MMNLFKKSNVSDDTTLFSPASGRFVKIEEVNDPLFSQKIMGDGYAVYPFGETITSPVTGKIVSIFPTKHAIGITSDNGDEIILHIGINTVELNGEPFELYVKENQKVTETTELVKMNLSMLEELNIDPTVIVVITNLKNDSRIELNDYGKVENCLDIGIIKQNK